MVCVTPSENNEDCVDEKKEQMGWRGPWALGLIMQSVVVRALIFIQNEMENHWKV